MNSMNTWIEHLHHPLVFAGFGLFLLALLLRPLFLNNKKLTGTATERLLSKGMILVFILALLAIIGGIALSWKATPEAVPEKTTGPNLGLQMQQYEERLKKIEEQLLAKQASGTVTDAKERQVLEAQLKSVQDKLANLQQSHEEELQRRKVADKALAEMKGELPEAKIAAAQKSLEQGDAEAAEQVFDEVVDKEGKSVALAAYQSGQLAEGRIDYPKAMRQYKKAVTLEEDNPDYLSAAGRMARTIGDYEQAQEWLSKLVAIIKGRKDEDRCQSCAFNDLAMLYYYMGRYAEAESLFKDDLVIKEQGLGKDHYNVATALNNLALLYDTQGRYEEAEPLYKRSLEIRENKLGKEHPEVATTLNNLAGLYESQGQYEEAEPLYKRSLEIKEEKLGKDHPSVATTLNNLAGLYEAQGRYEEAEPLYLRVQEIDKKNLGKDHPSVATTLNNLAGLYKSQGRYEEAEPLYQRAITIMQEKFPNGHPNLDTIQANYDTLKQKMAGKQ